MGSGDGDWNRSDLKLLGEVPRVNVHECSYSQFWKNYMRANKPVLLIGLMESWRACKDWVLESGAPNLPFIAENFGNSRVQVADCGTKEFSDQKRQEMTVKRFVKYWQELRENSKSPSCGADSSQLLYLKDWHFVKDFPDYCAYTTPEAFLDDWLNIYLDTFQMHSVDAPIGPKSSDDNCCSDYRFVYMGPKGTWTPLHADVLRSFSWSANVCGRKRWLLLPPEQVHLVYDRFQRDTIYDIYSEVSAKQFPGFSHTQWVECNQGAGEILFVPSGWFHQVTNTEDTISINHNWLNACNVHWAWRLLKNDYSETVKSIEDIRDISDDFEMLVQRNLAANSGMNYLDFAIFLAKMANSSIKLLSGLKLDLQDGRNSKDSSEWRIYQSTVYQILFSLSQIKQILEEMNHHNVLWTEDSSYAGLDCKHLEMVDKLQLEMINCSTVGSRCTYEQASPEMCFISEYLSKLSLVKTTGSAKIIPTTEAYTDDARSFDLRTRKMLIKQGIEGHAGPCYTLGVIAYILDIANLAGLVLSDAESCEIISPLSLFMDPS